MIVGFGYSLNDSVFGEFGVLDEIGCELSFGFHGEIKRKSSQALEL